MQANTRSGVTWQQVVDLAKSLEGAARAGEVPPQDGAQLVRLVLEFAGDLVATTRAAAPASPDRS